MSVVRSFGMVAGVRHGRVRTVVTAVLAAGALGLSSGLVVAGPATATAGSEVVAWGDDGSGATDVPPGLTGVAAVAAGERHSLALRSDGSVVAWGADNWGQIDVPGLPRVRAIAAGDWHSLALTSEGTVVGWGKSTTGQTVPPPGLVGVVAIDAGSTHSLALTSAGTVVAWGDDSYGQARVPAGLSGVTQVAAGRLHSLALRGVRSVGLTATFTVLEPTVCLRLSTTSLDFGRVPLGGSAELPAATTLTSCADGTTVVAQTSAATSSRSGVIWEPAVPADDTLCDSAAPSLNRFAYVVRGATQSVGVFLTEQPVILGALAAGGTRTDAHTLYPACVGSDGAGDTFTTAVVYTATSR